MPLTARRVLPVLVAALVAAAIPAASAASAAPDATTASAAPTSLAIVYPLTVPPTATGLLDADALTRYTAPLGLLTRQLDEVIDTPVAIGLDPMILASIRVLGAAAPQTATDWLDRLMLASNDVFPLAYADADTAIAAQAGITDALAPLGFDFAVDPNNFSPPQTDTPTPTPTDATSDADDTGPPPLPSMDDLLQFDYLSSGIAWPADDTVGKADLPKLKAAGFDTVILSSTNVTATTPLATVDGMRGIVSDDGISTLVRSATYAANDVELANALDRLVSGLAAVGDGRTVVATVDRHWPFTTMHLRETIDRIGATSAVRLVSLRQVLDAPSGTGTMVNKPEAADRSATVARMHDDELSEQEFSSVLTEPLELTAPRRLDLLATLTVSWQSDADGWAAATTAFVERSAQIVSSVQIVDSTSLLALSQNFGVPITVSNALDLPVTVLVTIDPQRPLLQVDGPVTVTVEPNSSNKAYVPAKAITNGEVFVRVSLSSPTGVAVGTPRILKVDLQAAWESIGTVIVVILLVLIFGGGIVRQVLKRRRSRSAQLSGPAIESDADG